MHASPPQIPKIRAFQHADIILPRVAAGCEHASASTPLVVLAWIVRLRFDSRAPANYCTMLPSYRMIFLTALHSVAASPAYGLDSAMASRFARAI